MAAWICEADFHARDHGADLRRVAVRQRGCPRARDGFSLYEAAEFAERIRGRWVSQGDSFVFETVLSDPVGEKVELRVSQGGHEAPEEKLTAHYQRALDNLGRALMTLPCVFVFDNSDLAQPYRLLAEHQNGQLIRRGEDWPAWFRAVARQE